jgi:hypothetical protein
MPKYTLVPNEDGFDRIERPAAPKLLTEQMRKLPGDYVTDEVAVEDRVHELDDPHTVSTIVSERLEEELGIAQPKEEEKKVCPPVNPDPRANTLNQLRVDEIRLRVMKAVSQTQMNNMIKGRTHNLDVRHLWFPKNDIREYELRFGNPPSDSSRPKHMRGLELHIDIMSGELPKTIVDRLPIKQKLAYQDYRFKLQNPEGLVIPAVRS